MQNNVNVNDEIILDIRKMGINGEGIGYYNKLAVFVDGAIVKETVKCKIIERKPKYAKAEIVEIVRQSTKRVEPFCKYYKTCGACQLQHIEYKEQLKIKKNLVLESIKRYTNLSDNDIKILDTVKNETIERGFRNKSQMPLKNTEFGLAMGLFHINSNKFIFVDKCPVQMDLINRINKDILTILRKHDVKACMNDKDGLVKYVITRSLINNHSSQVTLSVKKYDPILEKVAKDIMEIPTVKSCHYTIVKVKDEKVFGDEVVKLAGVDYLTDYFKGFKVLLSPKSFYQLNSPQAEKLYDRVVELLNLSKKDVVVDGYSGIGLIGMMMAKYAKEVIEIDYSTDSINDAKRNALENKVTNMKFYADKIENVLPKLLVSNNKPNILVLDPPRTGIDENVLKAILKSNVEKIVYISCNHSTLGKNLNELTKKYDIELVEPYDFFYGTSHVESLVYLKLKK